MRRHQTSFAAAVVVGHLLLLHLAQGQQDVQAGNLTVVQYDSAHTTPAVATPSLSALSTYVWTIQPSALPSPCRLPSDNSSLYLELWHNTSAKGSAHGSVVLEGGVLDAGGQVVAAQDPYAASSPQYQRIVLPAGLWGSTPAAAAWVVRVANPQAAAAAPAWLRATCLPAGTPLPCPSPDPRLPPCGKNGVCWPGGGLQDAASVCNCSAGWGGYACTEEPAALQLADSASLVLPAGGASAFLLTVPHHQTAELQLKWAGAPLPFGDPLLCARPYPTLAAPAADPLPPHTHRSWTCDAASAAALSPYHYLFLPPAAVPASGRLQVAVFNTAAGQESAVILLADSRNPATADGDDGCPFGCMGQRCAATAPAQFECQCSSTLAGHLCEAPRVRRVVQGEAALVTFAPQDVAPGQAVWHEVEVPPSSAFNPSADDIAVTWTVLPSSTVDPAKLVLVAASAPDLHLTSTKRTPPVTAASLPMTAATHQGRAVSLRQAGLRPTGANKHRCYILVQNRDFTAAGAATYGLSLQLLHPAAPLWHRPGFWSVLVVPIVLAVGCLALLWGFWHWRHQRAPPGTAAALESAQAMPNGAGHPLAVLLAGDLRPLKPGVPPALVHSFPTFAFAPPPAASTPAPAPAAAGPQRGVGCESGAVADADQGGRPAGGGEVVLQAATSEGGEAAAGQEPGGAPSCAVCLAEYEAGDRLRRLPCGHDFHVQCIDGWLQHHISCPICRCDVLLTADPTADDSAPPVSGAGDVAATPPPSRAGGTPDAPAQAAASSTVAAR